MVEKTGRFCSIWNSPVLCDQTVSFLPSPLASPLRDPAMKHTKRMRDCVPEHRIAECRRNQEATLSHLENRSSWGYLQTYVPCTQSGSMAVKFFITSSND